MIYFLLVVFGLIFGSFINALVWRVHAGKDFVRGRSECVNCGHVLAAKDLVPVFSWLALRGRCRYCKKTIDDSPLVEIALAVVFLLSYLFWPVSLNGPGELVLFIGWLITAVGLTALATYDLRWMILPNKILYPTLVVALATQLIYWLAYSPAKTAFIVNWLAAVAVASGIYLAMFIISQGRWIGFGDVRLGLVTGTVLHRPSLALLMIFFASVIGLLAVVPQLLTGKKQLTSRLPYGPCLILATLVCVLFGEQLINFYTTHLIP